MAHKPTLTLGQPVLISQAPADVRRWGPWQFPHLERLADGRLHLSYHIEADSARAYGLPVGHARSADGGTTWTPIPEAPANGGFLLPNGDRLRGVSVPSRKVEDVTLPPPFHHEQGTYAVTYDYYRAEEVSPALDGWWVDRLPKGATAWQREKATVRIPGAVRYATEGVFVFPWFYQDRLRLAPDGAVWAVDYRKRIANGKLQDKLAVFILRSTDNGHTWDLWSEIEYQPDRAADPQADARQGFTEPEVNFMPDGSVLCLIRTTDGVGVGPMYWARSLDNGQTWSVPQVFDDNGVWPQLLTLGNGVTLTAYGRPGLYVRATADPSAAAWGERVTVVPPGAVGKETCSYSDLIALSADTALLAYSDFNVPDAQGQPRKSILVRTVTAR